MHGNPPPSGFGVKLRELREARGLSRAELAALTGLHHNTLVKIEFGDREPQWPSVLALCEALGVKVQVFVPKRRKSAKRKRG
jgi:transcriptional regulator with XRE-family HTH domain